MSPHSGNGSRQQCFAIATRSQPVAAAAAAAQPVADWQSPHGRPRVPSSRAALSLSALCPAAMNKNRINLRQSRFSCLRSFVRFFLLALKGSPNSSRQLELEPSPGCTLLCLPLPPPSSYLLPVPPLCLSIVSIRNARVTGSARLPFSCFSPGDFTTPTAACQRERERERER